MSVREEEKEKVKRFLEVIEQRGFICLLREEQLDVNVDVDADVDVRTAHSRPSFA